MKLKELKKLQTLREHYKKTLNLSEDDETKLRMAIQKNQDLLSNTSSGINGDPVVFRSIDDVMQRGKRQGSIPSEGSLEGGDEYFKDDLTNYSKGLGLNKHKSNFLLRRRQIPSRESLIEESKFFTGAPSHDSHLLRSS
jgi:hypothetical protein